MQSALNVQAHMRVSRASVHVSFDVVQTKFHRGVISAPTVPGTVPRQCPDSAHYSAQHSAHWKNTIKTQHHERKKI